MNRFSKYRISFAILLVLTLAGFSSFAQIDPPVANTDTIPPIPSVAERAKNWGPNDTLIVSAIWYHNEMLPYKEMENGLGV